MKTHKQIELPDIHACFVEMLDCVSFFLDVKELRTLAEQLRGENFDSDLQDPTA